MVSAQQGQHTLIVNSGPNTGQTYVLHDMVSTLGRSADNTIVLDSTRVSRYHARISLLPAGVVIEDTGSTNGTYVNGQQITAQYQLSSGDMIGIADYITFQYVVEGMMGMGADLPPISGSSTQIMNGPAVFNPAQAPVTAPRIEAYTPAFQPNSYGATSPTGLPPAPDMVPEVGKKRPTVLYVIIALLVVFICLCVVLAVYLWFAPESFWRGLFDLFNIPWPSQLMYFLL